MANKKTTLSRDAEIVATSLFAFGVKSSVTFRRPHIIHPRTLAAIHELIAAEMAEEIPAGELPRDAAGWKGTEKIGWPMRDFKSPTEAENFPITTE